MRDESALRIEDLLVHAAWMRRLARSLVTDAATADDLTQEALLAAISKLPSESVPVRAWLAGVLRNVAASWRRSDMARDAREARIERKESAPSTDDLVEQVEIQQQLGEDVLALPDPFKRTVLLRYFFELSSAEIARRTNTPEGTVRWRLKRGLDLLRERLDERHAGERGAWVAIFSTGLGAPVSAPTAGLTGLSIAKLGLWLAAAALLAITIPWAIVRLSSNERPLDVALAPEVQSSASSPASAVSTADADAARGAIAPISTPPAERRLGVRARIVDAEGRAVEGASLRVALTEKIHEMHSDLAGEIEMSLPHPDADRETMLEFTLAAPGRLQRVLRARLRDAPILWLGELELPRAAALEGRVLGRDAQPMAGVELAIESLPMIDSELAERSLCARRFHALWPTERVAEGRSAQDGTYRFDHLPAGWVRVWARAPGCFDSHSQPIALHAGSLAEAEELVLTAITEAQRISGTAFDPGGEALAGVEVECIPVEHAKRLFEDSRHAWRTTTGEDGAFELALDPTPDYVIAARDPSGTFGRSTRRAARAGDRGLVLALEAGEFRTLRAVDPEGERLTHFTLEVIDLETGARIEHISRHATGTGVARFELPAKEFRLRVSRPGSRLTPLGPFQPGLADVELVVILPPTAPIIGRVLHAGQPVAGALVRTQRAYPDERWSTRSELTRGDDSFACLIASGGYDGESLTDAEGRFRLHPTSGGRLFVIVDAPGHPRRIHGPQAVRDRIAGGELELELTASASLEGQVIAAPGGEVAGSLVGVSAGDGRVFVRRVGPDGAYRFDGLSPGPWQVRPLRRDLDVQEEHSLLRHGGQHRRGDIEWDVQLESGAIAHHDLVLDGESRVSLEGRLLLDELAPGPWRVRLTALDGAAAGDRSRSALDGDGRFAFDLRGPGRFELRLSSAAVGEASFELFDEIVLGMGRNEWRLSLPTAWLELTHAEGDPPAEGPRTLSWHGTGELRFELELHSVPALLRVPVGRLVLRDDSTSEPRAEISAEAGERRRLIWR